MIGGSLQQRLAGGFDEALANLHLAASDGTIPADSGIIKCVEGAQAYFAGNGDKYGTDTLLGRASVLYIEALTKQKGPISDGQCDQLIGAMIREGAKRGR